ncbi:hypothetical protein TNCV_4400401 [Trichonephila clavipes]|nr:hypothetical protein TNCV_4400401 [Trichonephila clavipes]
MFKNRKDPVKKVAAYLLGTIELTQRVLSCEQILYFYAKRSTKCTNVDIEKAHSNTEQLYIGFKDLIPIALCFNSTRIEDVQWCAYAQNYATTDKNPFATKSDNFCLREMKANSIFFVDEDSMRTIRSDETRVITERITAILVVFTIDVSGFFTCLFYLV